MVKSEIFASVLRDVCEVTGIPERDIMSKSKSEEIVDKAPELLAELDTEHKAARETDRRLTALEGTLGEMRKMMREMMERR